MFQYFDFADFDLFNEQYNSLVNDGGREGGVTIPVEILVSFSKSFPNCRRKYIIFHSISDLS